MFIQTLATIDNLHMAKNNTHYINLICFHHAGGNRYSFLTYEAIAPDGINVIPLELPGRGDRLLEPLLEHIEEMVDDLFNCLEGSIDMPYIIYGHSMGAILGYLVTKKIEEKKRRLPEFLVFSGCEGPSVKDENKKMRSQLPVNEFIQELKSLGGIPDEVFQDVSFLDFFEPILRADFRALEKYEYVTSKQLQIPITVIIGRDEDISLSEASSWQDETTVNIEVIQFPGDHFFIFKHQKQIMEIIQNKINFMSKF